MALSLYRSVETASNINDAVLVSFSGGKDSVVTLDLCMKHFKHVEAFFMYYIKGLSFQESIIKYYEMKYHIPIYRIPHFELSNFFRYGTFRSRDFSVDIVGVKQVYDYMREKTGIYWIAAGERIADSIIRRAIIKNSGSIDPVRGRYYPVAEWNKEQIFSYVAMNDLRVGMDSSVLGSSFGSLHGDVLYKIQSTYPDDYKLIKQWFPLADAGVINYVMKLNGDDGEDENGEDDSSSFEEES